MKRTKKDSQDRTASTGQLGKDIQARKYSTVHPGQDRTAKTGLAGWDNNNRKTGTGQP